MKDYTKIKDIILNSGDEMIKLFRCGRKIRLTDGSVHIVVAFMGSDIMNRVNNLIEENRWDMERQKSYINTKYSTVANNNIIALRKAESVLRNIKNHIGYFADEINKYGGICIIEHHDSKELNMIPFSEYMKSNHVE